MPLTFARRTVLSCAAVPLFVLLGACEEETAQAPLTGEQGGEAAGDVLGGTIGDEMLPLERLRSQSPPLERRPGEDGEGTTPPDGAPDEGGEADDVADQPAPAPAPAPAAAPAPAQGPTGLPVAPPIED